MYASAGNGMQHMQAVFLTCTAKYYNKSFSFFTTRDVGRSNAAPNRYGLILCFEAHLYFHFHSTVKLAITFVEVACIILNALKSKSHVPY